MGRTSGRTGLRDLLRELAQHPGGVHSSNPQLAQWTPPQIGTQARKLVQMGQLFSAKMAHRHARYFATEKDRDSFIAQMDRSSRVQSRITGQHIQSMRAPWSDSEPGVETERTVYIKCPAFVPRFQEHVMPFVHGGLRAA